MLIARQLAPLDSKPSPQVKYYFKGCPAQFVTEILENFNHLKRVRWEKLGGGGEGSKEKQKKNSLLAKIKNSLNSV